MRDEWSIGKSPFKKNKRVKANMNYMLDYISFLKLFLRGQWWKFLLCLIESLPISYHSTLCCTVRCTLHLHQFIETLHKLNENNCSVNFGSLSRWAALSGFSPSEYCYTKTVFPVVRNIVFIGILKVTPFGFSWTNTWNILFVRDRCKALCWIYS